MIVTRASADRAPQVVWVNPDQIVQINCTDADTALIVTANGSSFRTIESFDSNSLTPFVYEVNVNQGPIGGLLAIRVTVEALDPDGGPPIARQSLTRWMIDPLLGLEQAEMEEEAAAAAAEEG